jgi:hypothetical protein
MQSMCTWYVVYSWCCKLVAAVGCVIGDHKFSMIAQPCGSVYLPISVLPLCTCDVQYYLLCTAVLYYALCTAVLYQCTIV